ncbi:MAG: flippase-like domain-containing protein, partial [Chlorobi bacterium]|nr:flippase-like domain-containing protein [Chlorobiota bacterium]
MSGKLKSFLKYFLSFIILVISVWYAVRDVNIYELKDVIFDADYLWVFLSVPVILLSHWVRAARWKTMLKPIKETKSVFNLFSAVMIGYFFNCVVPRGGEFIRPYVVARREKISYS